MFEDLFSFLPASQRGFIYLAAWLSPHPWSFKQTRFLQIFLNFILVAVGMLLVYQGLHKTNLLKKLKKSEK